MLILYIEDKEIWNRILAKWSTNWDAYDNKNFATVNNYLISILKDEPLKLSEFLMMQRTHLDKGDWKFEIEEIKKKFDINELNEIAKKYKGDQDISIEHRMFMDEFTIAYNDSINKDNK